MKPRTDPEAPARHVHSLADVDLARLRRLAALLDAGIDPWHALLALARREEKGADYQAQKPPTVTRGSVDDRSPNPNRRDEP